MDVKDILYEKKRCCQDNHQSPTPTSKQQSGIK